MRVPEWAAKFISRKLAVVAGTLLTHFLISRNMMDGQAAGWQEAIIQGCMTLADAAVTLMYLKEQSKLDAKDNAVPPSIGDKGVKIVLDAAKAKSK